MPSFDVVSEVDQQEVRNAVDQASREVANRFDFKGTDSSIELSENSIQLATESEQRLKALSQVLEEKLVKRKVSLKLLSYGAVEEASKGTVRQTVTLNVGISDEKAREIGKYIKGLPMKGIQHQIQGEQLRVTGKKRDDLQKVIGELKDKDFGIPLQFTNFRDYALRGSLLRHDSPPAGTSGHRPLRSTPFRAPRALRSGTRGRATPVDRRAGSRRSAWRGGGRRAPRSAGASRRGPRS